LANLGARTGYSSRQLRRLIGECFGITPEHILTTLQSGFGIGPWTANYIAMRALRLPDAFPTADLGLLKATGLTSGKKLESLSQKWRPWRAYATLHLWQSL
jgi:AraC family transcriptional regulator of adaptative response / DNA-3-methyladenine glycosylase II